MDLINRKDIRKLVLDARKVQERLDMLLQDHEARARERQENDLAEIVEDLKRLEADVSMLEADCMSMGRICLKDGAWPLQDGLHCAFATLNTLFNDLKKMRSELNEAYIRSADIEQLEIDWNRFRKTIGQVEKQLVDGEKYFEAKDVNSIG